MASKQFQNWLNSQNTKKDPWAYEMEVAELFGESVPDWDFDSIKYDEALVARLLFHEDSTTEGKVAIAWTLNNRMKGGEDLRTIIKEYYANPKWMSGTDAFFRPLEWLNTPGNKTYSKWHPDFIGEGSSTMFSWVMATHIAQDLLNNRLNENPFLDLTDTPEDVIQYVGLGFETENHARIGNSWFLVK